MPDIEIIIKNKRPLYLQVTPTVLEKQGDHMVDYLKTIAWDWIKTQPEHKVFEEKNTFELIDFSRIPNEYLEQYGVQNIDPPFKLLCFTDDAPIALSTCIAELNTPKINIKGE